MSAAQPPAKATTVPPRMGPMTPQRVETIWYRLAACCTCSLPTMLTRLAWKAGPEKLPQTARMPLNTTRGQNGVPGRKMKSAMPATRAKRMKFMAISNLRRSTRSATVPATLPTSTVAKNFTDMMVAMAVAEPVV